MDKLKSLLKQTEGDIICFQETHWTTEKKDEASRTWTGKIFSALYSMKSCGVAIMGKENIVQSEHLIYSDTDGRLLVLDFCFNNMEFRLINIYAGNDANAWKLFFEKVEHFSNSKTIIVGDFNVKLSNLDIGLYDKLRTDSSRTKLKEIMNNKNLIDILRLENPSVRAFSRRQLVLNSLKQTRIDLCLVSSKIINLTNKMYYSFLSHRDHA